MLSLIVMMIMVMVMSCSKEYQCEDQIKTSKTPTLSLSLLSWPFLSSWISCQHFSTKAPSLFFSENWAIVEQLWLTDEWKNCTPFYVKKLGQKSKSESAKCKRLSEKSHKYSHCRQEKCFSLYLHQDGYNDKDGDVLSFRSS